MGVPAPPRERDSSRPDGCIFRVPVDYPVMTVTEKPRSDEWAAGDDGPARLALFVDVEGAMKAGARKGIRRAARSLPSEHDVEDVVVQAFNELWRSDRSAIKSLPGMARTIAYRRGGGPGGRGVGGKGGGPGFGEEPPPRPQGKGAMTGFSGRTCCDSQMKSRLIVNLRTQRRWRSCSGARSASLPTSGRSSVPRWKAQSMERCR